MSSDGIRRAGDIRPVRPYIGRPHPEYLRGAGRSTSGGPRRLRANIKRAVDQFASEPGAHEQGVQGPDDVPELDQGGHYIRGGLR